MSLKTTVFSDMMSFCLADWYQFSRVACCLSC